MATGISIATSYDNDGYEMGIIAWRWRGWLSAMGRGIGFAAEFVTTGRLVFGRMRWWARDGAHDFFSGFGIQTRIGRHHGITVCRY